MTHIKKLVMHGFKSFARKTEIIFDKGINTIVGPNGSGKSNISDALCFVLGRLSIKSMRAAKAKNLLFMGTKLIKPSKEAFVEIIFDNHDKTFNIPSEEISIKRIVRFNGQSIYRLNNETKTRGEIIEMLAHAGIDPYGFNLILQGQIQAIVKAHPEERRKILEEVSGIAIYESRKEKSLHELDKTDERLKEITAVLRERTSFLKNLENERAQALKFKELEQTINRCKASIIHKKIEEKSKELESIKNSIYTKVEQKNKMKSKSEETQNEIDSTNEKIESINKHIKKSTGIEKESLQESISNLRAEIEGMKVRIENYENRKAEIENRIKHMNSSIPEYESEIKELRKKSPLVAKKQEELKKKKEELKILEEEKKKIYSIKTEINSLRERVKEKESAAVRINTESDSLLKQIEEYTIEFRHDSKEACEKAIAHVKKELSSLNEALANLSKSELASTKLISSAETQIESAEEIKRRIEKIDVCPLCQNKMTEMHIRHVITDSDSRIKSAKSKISEAENAISEVKSKKESEINKLKDSEKELFRLEKELSAHSVVREKQAYLKRLVEQHEIILKETAHLKDRKDALEKKSIDSSNIEERYSARLMEIEEISSRTEEDLDRTLLSKERDLEKIIEVIKRSKKDLEEIEIEIEELSTTMDEKVSLLEKREIEIKDLNEKFKKLFAERDSLHEDANRKNHILYEARNIIAQIEEQINTLKIGNAQISAAKEALEMELSDVPAGTEIIKASINVLEEKLAKAKSTIQTIGAINMRALEVYDEIKQEYDRVYEKVETLKKEKEQIIKIIEEIDNKKKKTFMKTFNNLNELFNRNFSQLSAKGSALLKIENKEDIFSGGVDIEIKLAKGKYFDVTSLSGGEQTLVALSLLFAIQEYKPYHFYIFDEIDAALDKRNSERLSALLNKYIQKGQYIIITHNDAIITNSNFLYGVSMHEGVSKVLSLKLD